MSGEKEAIDLYVPPVKSEYVIVEMVGKRQSAQVKPIWETVCHKLPFQAMIMSHEVLEDIDVIGGYHRQITSRLEITSE